MSIQALLSRTTIAAALIAAAPLAAQATAFNAPATATFALSSTIVGLQGGSTPITVTVPAGSSTTTDSSGRVTSATLPLTSVDVTGTNLNTFAGVGSGLTLTSGTASVSLTDFVYTTSDKLLNFTLTVGGVSGSLTGAFVASSQSTTTAFVDGVNAKGVFTATGLKLTESTADAVVAGLGLDSFYAGILASVNFGNVTVNVKPAVPEPSTYALIGLGMAGAVVVARRRKQQA
ncbi:MAG: PEP-CTERM sorting domain-containing protein [Aquabacterium sp.]|nr:MAG: PEP-CTERM sorting domain-containing protein [Aquabacterium sp.]